MKLHILHLDPNEDLASAQDKLAWAQAERVVLVWPRYGDVLQRRLDLVLLERTARARGRTLAILSHDPIVRDHARLAGLPLFDSLDDMPEAGWRRPRGSRFELPTRAQPDGARPPLPAPPPAPPGPAPAWQRYLAAGLGLLALLLLSAALLPSATITVSAERRSRQGEWTFSLRQAEIGGDDDAAPTLPWSTTTAEVEVSAQTSVTGRRQTPTEPASGTLVFTNLTDSAVTVPAGASVRTATEGGQRFVTTAAAQVPAPAGSQVEVEAVAFELGAAGNVPAQSIIAIDGPLGLSLSVDNPQPFTGGASSLQPVVSAADQQRLLARAEAQLLSLGRQVLQRQLPVGQLLAQDSLQLTRVIETDFDRVVGEPAAGLRLRLVAEVEAVSIPIDQAEPQLEAAILKQLQPGWALIPDSVTLQLDPNGSDSNGGQTVVVLASWQEDYSLNLGQLAERVRGMEVSRADEVLAAQPGVASASIAPHPGWLQTLPWIGARLRVVLRSEAG